MIVIIKTLDNTFHYCLVPVCMSRDVHQYVNHLKHTHVTFLDFHLEPYEIGQILGGN
jgi:hypothetical protein